MLRSTLSPWVSYPVLARSCHQTGSTARLLSSASPAKWTARPGCRVASVRLAPNLPRLSLRPAAFNTAKRWFSDGRVCQVGVKNQGPLSGPSPQRKETPIASVLSSVNKATKHENIYTIPNILTASRLVAAPFIGYAILHDQHVLALALFAWAGVSDALDGWIARRWNQGTVVGTVIDPMADKTLMTVLTVCLAVKGALPVWLAVIILGRDVGLAISAIYYRWISLPPPKTFARYWDFSLPSAEVHPTGISKVNTFLQLGLMGMTTLAPVAVGVVDLQQSLVWMQYVVATTTVWSGASYVYSKDAVKILSPETSTGNSTGSSQETDSKSGK